MRVDAGYGPHAYRSALSNTGQAGVRARAVDAAAGPAEGRRAQQPAAPRRVDELTAAEQRLIQALRNRDREVRAHELAHQSVGGRYAGSARYRDAEGPDGRRYAVGGEVDIDLRRSGDPEQDLRMAEQVRRAALAPAEPSAQDQRIAARAAAIAAEARQALATTGEGTAAPGEGGGRSGSRPVQGEYIDRVAGRRARVGDTADSPLARQFAAVQGMGGAELMSQGGRLDLFA